MAAGRRGSRRAGCNGHGGAFELSSQTTCHERSGAADLKFLDRSTTLFTVPISCLLPHLLRPPPMPEIKAPTLLDNSPAAPAVAPSDNPLLEDWTAAGGVPPFSRIRAEHFLPAYAQALAEHAAEIATIAAAVESPTFANTIAALELSGRKLERIDNVFSLLAGADTNDALQEIERAISPQLARHWSRIRTNAALFRRIDAVMATA